MKRTVSLLLIIFITLFGLTACSSKKSVVENNINTQAESLSLDTEKNNDGTTTVYARIFPYKASEKKVTFSIYWNNKNSDFAKDKNVNDYVKLETIGPVSCNLTALQAFSEPVVLKAISTNNLSSTTMIQYGARVLKFYPNGNQVDSMDLALSKFWYYEDSSKNKQFSASSIDGCGPIDFYRSYCNCELEVSFNEVFSSSKFNNMYVRFTMDKRLKDRLVQDNVPIKNTEYKLDLKYEEEKIYSFKPNKLISAKAVRMKDIVNTFFDINENDNSIYNYFNVDSSLEYLPTIWLDMQVVFERSNYYFESEKYCIFFNVGCFSK